MKIKTSLVFALLIFALSSCQKKERGCNNSYASNFLNSSAINDGSCQYQPNIKTIRYALLNCVEPYELNLTADIYPLSDSVGYNFENTITIDFGDGEQETIIGDLSNGIRHVYQTGGEYIIKVMLSNEWGRYEKYLTIGIGPDFPVESAFEFKSKSSYNCLSNAQVSFQNNSLNSSEYL
ncbi:MAG: hypothetical protein GY810_04825 [Aureispira sp.]|nr:hypothetical protein [Aureispira sp.]